MLSSGSRSNPGAILVSMDDKVELDHMGAAMSLPPAPVVLVGVGDKEKNIITVGMFKVFSVRPPRPSRSRS